MLIYKKNYSYKKCAEHLYAPTGSPQTQTSDRNVCALLRDALYLFVWLSFCFEVVIRRRHKSLLPFGIRCKITQKSSISMPLTAKNV